MLALAAGCGSDSKEASPSGTVSSSKTGANPLAVRNGQGEGVSALPVKGKVTSDPPNSASGTPSGLAATPPDAKQRQATPPAKPLAGRVRGDIVYSDSGVNCNEADNQIWMEVNFPSTVKLIRGAGSKQRIAFTAYVRAWQGSRWSAWAQILDANGKPTWITGNAYGGNTIIIGGNGGNAIWYVGGQQAWKWVSAYVSSGYYQWYTKTYFYADNHYEGGLAVHNNANGEQRWCDFVT